jgi:hypothetical protein
MFEQGGVADAGHNAFLRLFAALMLVAILPVTGQAIAQSNRTQLLTPKGTLRAALIISDSVLVTRNPQGELGGILVVEFRHLVPCFRLWAGKMPELAMCASAKQCPLCLQ